MKERSKPGALKVVGARDWTPADDEWQRRALQWELDALPALRASAERWAAGLATLLSGVGLGALLAGPERFDRLADPYQGVAKAIFAVAAVAAAAALVAALTAGASTSRRLFLVTGPAIRRASRDAVRSGLRQLTISRWSAGVAVLLLLVCGGVLFFAPEKRSVSTPSSAILARGGLPGP